MIPPPNPPPTPPSVTHMLLRQRVTGSDVINTYVHLGMLGFMPQVQARIHDIIDELPERFIAVFFRIKYQFSPLRQRILRFGASEAILVQALRSVGVTDFQRPSLERSIYNHTAMYRQTLRLIRFPERYIAMVWKLHEEGRQLFKRRATDNEATEPIGDAEQQLERDIPEK